MKNVTIKLETINDVKNFVSAVTTFECDFDIVADRYIRTTVCCSVSCNRQLFFRWMLVNGMKSRFEIFILFAD